MLNHSFNIEITRSLTTPKKQNLIDESLNEPDDSWGTRERARTNVASHPSGFDPGQKQSDQRKAAESGTGRPPLDCLARKTRHSTVFHLRSRRLSWIKVSYDRWSSHAFINNSTEIHVDVIYGRAFLFLRL
jgi:hypothetical protein